ncbi:MAG: carboxypeptidase regulatory-like domain-containing protein [Planctomycetota bacterium]
MTASAPRLALRRWCSFVLAGVALVGCSHGVQVGSVRGTVTYRGQPLAGIKVTFDPRAGGRSSTGLTGADGGYELNYTRGRKGALVGTHDVRVNWPAQTAEDLAKRDTYPISAAYNTATTLTFDVKRGSNTCDLSIGSP